MNAKPFPLSALDTCADGQGLAVVRGRILSLYPRKSGTTKQDKPWSIQNGTLRGEDGTEVGLFIKDRDELEKGTWEGKDVEIVAKEGKTLSGIYVMDDDYKGTITRKLKITPTAELSFVNAEPAQNYQPADQDGDASPASGPSGYDLPFDHPEHPDNLAKAQRPSQGTPAKPAADHSEVREARKTILQIANLHLACQLAVDRYECPTFKKMTGHDMSEDQRRAAVASIFIKADREGLVRAMPTSNLADHPEFQAPKN